MRIGAYSVISQGNGYVVLKGAERISGPHSHRELAMAVADDRARLDGAKERPCIRCQTKFMSEGAHNRMCDPCRKAASDIFEGAV
jgi:hypothetical protein